MLWSLRPERIQDSSLGSLLGHQPGDERMDCQAPSRTLDARWHESVVGHKFFVVFFQQCFAVFSK